MSSFCTAKATHIFSAKTFSISLDENFNESLTNDVVCTAKATHIFSAKTFSISLDVNFNESLTNDVVSFEQLGPGFIFYLNDSY